MNAKKVKFRKMAEIWVVYKNQLFRKMKGVSRKGRVKKVLKTSRKVVSDSGVDASVSVSG